jgi:hypothetical protein
VRWWRRQERQADETSIVWVPSSPGRHRNDRSPVESRYR